MCIRDRFEEQLLNSIKNLSITGKEKKRLPNTSSVIINGVIASELVTRLESRGITISAGSACKTGNAEPSAVLKATGLSDAECFSTIRISFGPIHTKEDAGNLVVAIKKEVSEIRKTNEKKLEQMLKS